MAFVIITLHNFYNDSCTMYITSVDISVHNLCKYDCKYDCT